MTMQTGARTVRGKIKRREEARAIYAAARDAGYAASLLDQERPNIFTQSVANIGPVCPYGPNANLRGHWFDRIPVSLSLAGLNPRDTFNIIPGSLVIATVDPSKLLKLGHSVRRRGAANPGCSRLFRRLLSPIAEPIWTPSGAGFQACHVGFRADVLDAPSSTRP
jgi:hypothetical protein